MRCNKYVLTLFLVSFCTAPFIVLTNPNSDIVDQTESEDIGINKPNNLKQRGLESATSNVKISGSAKRKAALLLSNPPAFSYIQRCPPYIHLSYWRYSICIY